MRLSFFGACREVSGTNFLLEVEDKKILLECGYFQGSSMAEERNYADFPYKAGDIDFVIVCHAHLDHTGRLPKLARDGFRGRIYSTAPTKELTHLVLEDNRKLMEEEARRNAHEPLYFEEDVQQVMELFESLDYGEKLEISPGIQLTLRNAGHILGSATCTIEAEGKILAYTSDLGNTPSLLMESPTTLENADFLICESTYGGRIHEDVNRRAEKLDAIINSTITKNAVLLIPSFAIERTQELLHDVDRFCTLGNCEKPRFYLDSPLAEKVTGVFKKYPEYLRKAIQGEGDEDFLGLWRIDMTSTVEQSKGIRDYRGPKVIIAGSGMMNGGRILYHAIDFLPDEKNTLLFVGYQARGTLGRRIFEGEREIKIHGKKIIIRAQVTSIGSYSAHADGPQLVSWISKISGLRKVFLVHGESDQAIGLAKSIEKVLKIEAVSPQVGESYEL